MITFESGIDIRCRQMPAPTVARFAMGDGSYRFVVVGTQYGYLHTTNGGVRTWQTYSGARRAIRNYHPL